MNNCINIDGESVCAIPWQTEKDDERIQFQCKRIWPTAPYFVRADCFAPHTNTFKAHYSVTHTNHSQLMCAALFKFSFANWMAHAEDYMWGEGVGFAAPPRILSHSLTFTIYPTFIPSLQPSSSCSIEECTTLWKEAKGGSSRLAAYTLCHLPKHNVCWHSRTGPWIRNQRKIHIINKIFYSLP